MCLLICIQICSFIACKKLSAVSSKKSGASKLELQKSKLNLKQTCTRKENWSQTRLGVKNIVLYTLRNPAFRFMTEFRYRQIQLQKLSFLYDYSLFIERGLNM